MGNKDQLNTLFKKYELEKEDTFKHKHYNIICRSGIDKIMAKAGIHIEYEIVKIEKDFCVIKATGTRKDVTIETFGSALYGAKKLINNKWLDTGTTTSWYVTELAEKRAMSRIVLKLCGFYELGVFGEDEAESFKKSNNG